MTLARVSNFSSARAKTTTCPDFPFLFADIHSALVASNVSKIFHWLSAVWQILHTSSTSLGCFFLIMSVMNTRRQNFTAGKNFNTAVGMPLALEIVEKSAALMTKAPSNMAAHKV